MKKLSRWLVGSMTFMVTMMLASSVWASPPPLEAVKCSIYDWSCIVWWIKWFMS